MKKIGIFIIIVLALAFSAYFIIDMRNTEEPSSDRAAAGMDKTMEQAEDSIAFTEETIALTDSSDKNNISSTENEDFSISEYEWSQYSYYYITLVITNNTSETYSFHPEFVFYDAAGNLIGSRSDFLSELGSGETYVIDIQYDEPYDSYSYTLGAQENPPYRSMLDDANIEITETDSKYVFSCTNQSKDTITYATYHIVYFKNDAVVDTYWGIIGYSIAPGESKYDEQKKTSVSYDSVEIHLNAY